MTRYEQYNINFIIITMPVLKTFKGKIKIDFKIPFVHTNSLFIPKIIKINTSNSLTVTELKKNINNNNFFNFASKMKYLESISLNIERTLENYNNMETSYIIEVDFTKQFNSIIFEMYKEHQIKRYGL